MREDGLDNGGVLDGLRWNHSVTAAGAAKNVVVKNVGKDLSPEPAGSSRDARLRASATLECLEREANGAGDRAWVRVWDPQLG